MTIKKNTIIKVSIAHLFLFTYFFGFCGNKEITRPLQKDKHALAAYEAMLDLRLTEARTLLEHPKVESAHKQFSNSLADIIEIIFKADQATYDSLINNETVYLNNLSNLAKKDPHKLYYMSEVRIQWAVVKLMFSEEVKAGWSLKTAYGEIEDNIKRFPDFEPNYKALGSLKILFSAMPESYHWLLNLFGIDPNSHDGWKLINKISPKSPYYLETSIIKTLVSTNIIGDKEIALNEVKRMAKLYPKNQLSTYFRGITLIKYAQSETALPLLQQTSNTDTSHVINHYSRYQLASIYLQKQSYDSARLWFQNFLNEYTGTNLVKDSYFKIGVSHYLQKHTFRAMQYFSQARKEGSTKVEEDKNAFYLLIQNSYPPSSLLKIRYATDGGYFDLAKRELENLNVNDFKSSKYKIELQYRKARLFDKLGDIKNAIPFYEKTIELSGENNWYFAPASCLNLGKYYASIEKYDLAKSYLKKVLSYKRHQYKAGLDNKAKVALQGLPK
ncbi:tetratricopeptide repeat protein [Reichenbachiella versicolor]|uniref:tetratricopeptide repeat protein n=1 Tax=Reichenbachiella versicolor TaxID=1821036 RepID=UPI0013A57EAB|nr:hypothetical protein [Reichenbachiella versicolor]